MKRSNFTKAQIAFVLKQAEDGTSVAEICRKAGIAEATFFNWRKKYGGLIPSEMKRLKLLAEKSPLYTPVSAPKTLFGHSRQCMTPVWIRTGNRQHQVRTFPCSAGSGCRRWQ